VKKSKCAGLSQKIAFPAPNLCSLPVASIWHNTVAQHNCAPPNESVINWTWLQLSISDWSIIMIGLGGLLLVVPTYMQFRLQNCSWDFNFIWLFIRNIINK
jgi:hypothetical protein